MEPNPLYRKYGYFAGVDLSEIDPASAGPAVALPALAPDVVRVVHDPSGSRIELPKALADRGVRIEPLASIWSGPEEARTSFLRGLEAQEDRLSALAIALLNRGYR